MLEASVVDSAIFFIIYYIYLPFIALRRISMNRSRIFCDDLHNGTMKLIMRIACAPGT